MLHVHSLLVVMMIVVVGGYRTSGGCRLEACSQSLTLVRTVLCSAWFRARACSVAHHMFSFHDDAAGGSVSDQEVTMNEADKYLQVTCRTTLYRSCTASTHAHPLAETMRPSGLAGVGVQVLRVGPNCGVSTPSCR